MKPARIRTQEPATLDQLTSFSGLAVPATLVGLAALHASWALGSHWPAGSEGELAEYVLSAVAKDSVGAKQIRKGAVRSQEVANGAVKAGDLSSGVRGQLTVVERASVAGDGSLRGGTAAGVQRTDPSSYTVTFRRSVARCSYAATLATSGTGDPSSGSTKISGSGGKQVTITTFDSAGTAVAAGFDLLVVC